MIPRLRFRDAPTWAAAAVIATAILGGCDIAPAPTELIRPTPTPGPPILRTPSGSTRTFDGLTWTLSVIVSPMGEPTDIVIEWGTGDETGPFDHVIPMAEDVLDAGQISIRTRDLPVDGAFCTRFTATNSFGSASTPAWCLPVFPTGTIMPSDAAPTPSPAAS